MQQQKMSPVREFELEEKLEVGGAPGMTICMSYSLSDPALEVRATQAYVVHGNRAYAITLTTPKDLHAEYQGLFRAILESVRFAS
jgi:hypothetical protein